MTQLNTKESGAARTKRANGSSVSELEEVNLDETIPTDEDLQPVYTEADKSFAAAMTDMMLDEIHEDASEKVEEVIEEDLDKLDSQAVIEATEEEVRNTMTRPSMKNNSGKAEVDKSNKEVDSNESLRENSSPLSPRVNNESKENR